MDNKQRIIDTARRLYNQLGLKAVTARVICEELKISPGSFSYHFKDKSLIISILYSEMQKEMAQCLTVNPTHMQGVTGYLDTHRKLFAIQEKYKFFYLNLFEILSHHEEIKKDYLKNIQQSRQMGQMMFQYYINQGVFKKEANTETIDRLINVGQILNTFWTMDAEIMPPKYPKEKLIHYMKICCGLLEPFLEAQALDEYHRYFENLKNDKLLY